MARGLSQTELGEGETEARDGKGVPTPSPASGAPHPGRQ